MSLSNSISSALSGLRANSLGSKTVASNLSNALNENYAKREVELTARSDHFGGGVTVSGVSRWVDAALLSDLREASANLERVNAIEHYVADIDRTIGSVDDVGSFSSLYSDFEDALMMAQSLPSSELRLQEIGRSLEKIVTKFETIESKISEVRAKADRQILETVEILNEKLKNVDLLNEKIVQGNVNRRDVSGLEDQRQKEIDEIAKIVPVREIDHGYGDKILVSQNGAILLESTPAKFGFVHTHTIEPHMTISSGDLEVISFGDISYNPGLTESMLSGGKLEGLFNVRDSIATKIQNDLDNLAFEFASRLDEVEDDSRSLGDPGILTDSNTGVDILQLRGLSGRLSINENLSSSAGGSELGFRDGIYSTTMGPTGRTELLNEIVEKLSNHDSSITAGFTKGTMEEFYEQFQSKVGQSNFNIEQDFLMANSFHEQLKEMHLAQGVDTDIEIQKLIEIEKNYQANAKVIQAVEAMLDSLMELA